MKFIEKKKEIKKKVQKSQNFFVFKRGEGEGRQGGM